MIIGDLMSFAATQEVLLSEHDVVVTKTLVKVAETSYPMNGIGSVRIMEPSRAVLCLVAGAFVWIGIWLAQDRFLVGVACWAIAAVIVWIVAKMESALVLRTASGDQKALLSRDEHFLRRVQAAIEQGVAQRG